MCLAPRLCHIGTNHPAAVAVLPSCPRGRVEASIQIIFIRRVRRSDQLDNRVNQVHRQKQQILDQISTRGQLI